MAKEWTELVRLTGGAPLVVERVRLPESAVTIEGEFALPLLAQLSADDQVFVMAFVGAHGSLKDMERLFGISYPTVKSRLDRLADKLKMVEMTHAPEAADGRAAVLDALEQGEISADEAVRRLAG